MRQQEIILQLFILCLGGWGCRKWASVQCSCSYQFIFSDSALFFNIHLATVPQSTGRWASSVHCNVKYYTPEYLETKQRIGISLKGQVSEGFFRTTYLVEWWETCKLFIFTYIPAKAIWTMTSNIITSAAPNKINRKITSRSRAPFGLWREFIRSVNFGH